MDYEPDIEKAKDNLVTSLALFLVALIIILIGLLIWRWSGGTL